MLMMAKEKKGVEGLALIGLSGPDSMTVLTDNWNRLAQLLAKAYLSFLHSLHLPTVAIEVQELVDNNTIFLNA